MKRENFSAIHWSWSTSFVEWVLQFSTFKGLMTVNEEVFQFTKVKFKLRRPTFQSENVCHPSLKFSNQKSWKVADSQAQIAIWQKFELFFLLSFLKNVLPNSISSIIIWLPKRETHWISWSRSTFHIIRSFRAYKTLWNLRKKVQHL